VRNLKEKLKQKDMLIGQLQNQLKMVEKNVKSDINKDLENIRANDRQEIQ
jgi:hypothetical protein